MGEASPLTASAAPDPAVEASANPAATLRARFAAELLGTMLLVSGGIGVGVLTMVVPGENSAVLSTGYVGAALAIGFGVIVCVYTFGPISGAHLNPAVTAGLCAAGRFRWREAPVYVTAQLLGATAGAGLIAAIAASNPAVLHKAVAAGFTANGYGPHSPGGYGLTGTVVAETVFMAMFVLVILGTTARDAAAGFAPLATGLALTLIGLITIPVDGTSLNPARSVAAALFGGSWALEQLWVFLLFPVLGAVLAGAVYRPVFSSRRT